MELHTIKNAERCGMTPRTKAWLHQHP